jgi:hypothetical protein
MKLIKVEERDDGFGSQFQNIISTILYAKFNNMEYVHFPIKTMAHNYDEDPDFLDIIEETMNISKKYRRDKDLKKKEKQKVISKLWMKREMDNNIDKYLKSKELKDIKKNYFKNKCGKKQFFNINKVNVAIHVRNLNSHDTEHVQRFGKNWIETQSIDLLKLIKSLEDKYGKDNIVFHIFSQGNTNEFKTLTNNRNNMELHLNDPVEYAFHLMALADILVINKSSYSYCAALICNAKQIYYKKFWHKPGNNWIQY